MVVVRVTGEVQPFVEAVVADGLEWVGAEVSKDAVDVVRRERVSRARREYRQFHCPSKSDQRCSLRVRSQLLCCDL